MREEKIADEEHTTDEELDDSLSVSERSSDMDSGREDDNQSRQPSITPSDEQAGDVTTSLKKSREDDIQKGQAVKAQLVRGNILRLYVLTCVFQQLWDTLLDMRIRLQKSMVAANRFPAVSSTTLRVVSNHFHPAASPRRIFTIF